jgi:hypothetical protein
MNLFFVNISFGISDGLYYHIEPVYISKNVDLVDCYISFIGRSGDRLFTGDTVCEKFYFGASSTEALPKSFNIHDIISYNGNSIVNRILTRIDGVEYFSEKPTLREENEGGILIRYYGPNDIFNVPVRFFVDYRDPSINSLDDIKIHNKSIEIYFDNELIIKGKIIVTADKFFVNHNNIYYVYSLILSICVLLIYLFINKSRKKSFFYSKK